MIAQPLIRDTPTLREIMSLTQSIRASDKSNVTGDLGENLFTKLLCPLWQAVKPESCRVGDFRITDTTTGEVLQVEVKTAKKGKGGRYDFQLYKNDKHGKTDANDSDLLALICIDGAGATWCYIMPTDATSAKKITIPSHPTRYTGKYAKWLQRGLKIAPLDAIEIYQLSTIGRP